MSSSCWTISFLQWRYHCTVNRPKHQAGSVTEATLGTMFSILILEQQEQRLVLYHIFENKKILYTLNINGQMLPCYDNNMAIKWKSSPLLNSHFLGTVDTTAAKSTVAEMINSVKYTLSPAPQTSIKLITRMTDQVRGIICNQQCLPRPLICRLL